MKSRPRSLFTFPFLCVVIVVTVERAHLVNSLAQEAEHRDTKQHPELSTLRKYGLNRRVRNWAQKLGGELWSFGEMVTRKNAVIESFKSMTVITEDGDTLLKDVHEKISTMMKQKVEAVRRIMDIAEQAAKDQKEDDIDFNFQFVNAKNLTNTAPNLTLNDQEDQLEQHEGLSKHDDSFISVESLTGEHYQAMVQPEQSDGGYQQDENVQDKKDPREENDTSDQIEATDNSEQSEPEPEPEPESEAEAEAEKDPQASQVPHHTDRTRLPLYNSRHFYNIPVNTNFSAVHVPSNVYERSKEVISGIIWSEELDNTFRSNYKVDPSLSWQYFGSSTGFMRQFPAMIWSQEPIDLFDCRTRSWYIEAASSPKDVVILVDRSGSMTGMRREVAQHVVHNILDTLGNNDYVNIYTFSNTTEPLVDCFESRLVQANLANVRVLKDAMGSFKTEQIANFSEALVTAFELLETYRDIHKGAKCNQAIMLVTDGVHYNFKEIFERYNWQELPFVNVRVFTYLIGREVSDVREVKWMACANRGYYVHLSTYAEVREEVLHYIPVMARPMVLNGSKPDAAWSPVYADVTDPKLTNWLWVNRERNRQRERFLAYRRNKMLLPTDEQDKRFVHQQKHKQDNYGDLQTYRLMTSVSLPVYDKKPRAERVANLLGVAGTDVPIEYILTLMLPYRLGVNGYAFIVTNNGYILTHPDLRPVGILKPAYNRVDLTEIEILDDETEPRDFGTEILSLRSRIIFQERGNTTLRVKWHIDEMRRLVTGVRHYFYRGIEETPFTIVVALPHRYGFSRVQHPVEHDIHRLLLTEKSGSVLPYFNGNWTVHPDWHYCRYLDNGRWFDTPEQEFVHFLRNMSGPGWKWSKECDRKLVSKIVADAKATQWFNQNITTTSKEENGPRRYSLIDGLLNFFHAALSRPPPTDDVNRAEFIRRFGITVAFMATHSGLTRWQEFPQNIDSALREDSGFRHFHILHNKAIDEVWYKRAVEHHYIDPSSFVYSVPFDIGDLNGTLITVSHAVFREEGGSKKAPAAVIGYQFYHSALSALFRKITSSCGDIACKRTCESNELHCLMLDDNGYIVVSDNAAETGYFFGKIRPDIMDHLIEEGVYRKTKMYDYQGLCAEVQETNSPATTLAGPLEHLSRLMTWAVVTVTTLLRTVTGSNSFNDILNTNDAPLYPDEEDVVEVSDDESGHDHGQNDNQHSSASDKEFDQRLLIKKTKPEPCDHVLFMYNLNMGRNSSAAYNRTMVDCSRPFIIYRVSESNMLLLVINNLCREEEERAAPSTDPIKVDYNMTLACYRVLQNDFPRRHYMSCMNRNVNESEIKLCGRGTRVSSSILSVIAVARSLIYLLLLH